MTDFKFPSPGALDPIGRLRVAWRHYPPEPDLLQFVDKSFLLDDLLTGEFLICDAEERATRGLTATLAHYLHMLPDIMPGSEASQLLLLREVVQMCSTSSNLGRCQIRPVLLAHYGHAFAGDVDGAIASFCVLQNEVFPGDRLGNYEVVEHLGRGSFGQVVQAYNHEMGCHVALKLFPCDNGLHDDQTLAALKSEVAAASSIHHPNVVAVRAIGRLPGTKPNSEGWLFIDMQLCGDPRPAPHDSKAVAVGKPLPEFIRKRTGSVSAAWAATGLTRQLCDGLREAHLRGVIHCDIKPANVLVTPSGRPMLSDFGLSGLAPIPNAALGGTQMKQISTPVSDHLSFRGTPTYTSPEQARGERASMRSDIYGIGAVFYFMLTGCHPYTSRLPVDTGLEQHQRDILAQVGVPTIRPTPISDSVPRVLRAICAKALAYDPAARYGSVEELAGDLCAALEMRTTRALPLDPLRRFALWCQQPDRIFQGAITVLAVIGGSAIFHLSSLLLSIATVYGAFDFFDPQRHMKLRYHEIIATTAVFGTLGAAGAWAAYRSLCGRQRWLWSALIIMLLHLGWVVLVLTGLVAFDVGGLLHDPASLRTVYLLFLILAAFGTYASAIALLASYRRIDTSA
jgi:serine/threonine protein kinase